jgi:glutaminyl-peptide cyclotransferase
MTVYLLIPVVYAFRISVACCLFLLLDTTIAYTPLSDDGIRGIPSGGDDFDVHNGSLLAPILIERVPGTEGSTRVQKHFVDFFTRDLPEWEIEWHHSTSITPATGNHEVPFRNLILRRDPPGVAPGNVSRLTLAAHYDSLRKSGFVGATDSAAPCAILMHVARSIDSHLQRKWYVNSPSGLDLGQKGVQILFLDGEEAFSHWTATDSLYGARYVSHLVPYT